MLPYLLESIIYLFFIASKKEFQKLYASINKTQFAFAANNIANISLVI